MKNIIILSFSLYLLACSTNSGRNDNLAQSNDKQASTDEVADTSRMNFIGENWGNITVDTAKILIRTFCEYSDSMGEKNVTKAVWFRRSEIHESFNKIFKNAEVNLMTQLDYDGYRIYFARYPGNWNEPEKRYQNTLVITKTRSTMIQGMNAHEDILEINKFSGIFVQPLNDGGRCRPVCNGVMLLDEQYTQERKN